MDFRNISETRTISVIYFILYYDFNSKYQFKYFVLKLKKYNTFFTIINILSTNTKH